MLNIGFNKAVELGCDYVAFHDVDMLPHDDVDYDDYDTAYDVYFYVNSGTRVANQVFESDSTDKRSLKKMFMSGMKKRINSRVLLQNFIKRIA